MSLATAAEVIRKWTTDDFAFHPPGAPAPLDRAAYIELCRTVLAGFSDCRRTVTRLIAEGDFVSVVLTPA